MIALDIFKLCMAVLNKVETNKARHVELRQRFESLEETVNVLEQKKFNHPAFDRLKNGLIELYGLIKVYKNAVDAFFSGSDEEFDRLNRKISDFVNDLNLAINTVNLRPTTMADRILTSETAKDFYLNFFDNKSSMKISRFKSSLKTYYASNDITLTDQDLLELIGGAGADHDGDGRIDLQELNSIGLRIDLIKDSREITLSYTNGNSYIGTVYKNQPHGRGKYICVGRYVYEGDFVLGFKQGNGKIIFNDGEVYVGELRNGRHGKGICIMPSGEKFSTVFDDDKLVIKIPFETEAGNSSEESKSTN